MHPILGSSIVYHIMLYLSTYFFKNPYKSGSYDDHAHLGAEYARKLLEKLAITTPEETDIICAAIWHHDSKAEVDGTMDEILKDADVIDHSLSDPTKEVKAHEVARYAKLCEELGLVD